MRNYQKYAATVAVFAAVLYAALLVAAFGILSLLTDLDVIADPDVGRLVGPVMTTAAVLLVFSLMLYLGIRTPPDQQRIVVGYAVGAGLAAVAAFLVTGALLHAGGTGVPFAALTFSADTLRAPFVWTLGVLAFVVTLLYSWVLASHFTERGRPLWPWERRGE